MRKTCWTPLILSFLWICLSVQPCNGDCQWRKGDNSTKHLSLLGFVEDDYVITPHSVMFTYDFGYKLFKNLWNVEVINSLPDWLNYNGQSLTLKGTPQREDIGEYTVNTSVRAKQDWNDCSDKMMLGHMTIKVVESDIVKQQSDKCKLTPVLKSPLDQILAVKGRPYLMPVCDAFHGPTDLSYSITLRYGQQVGQSFWLHVDSATQSLYGIPWMNKNSTTDVISLVATDICNNVVKDAIKISVSDDFPIVTHIFKFVFHTAMKPVLLQSDSLFSYLVKLVNTLEEWLEEEEVVYIIDVDVENMTVSWTYQAVDCSEGRMEEILTSMSHSDGFAKENFMCFMNPFFPVESILLDTMYACNDSRIYEAPRVDFSQVTQSKYKSIYEHYLEVVVPCLALILVLTVAFVIVMICNGHYSKHRKSYILKSEKSTYLEDRKPVIFPEETYAMETTLAPRSPVILASNIDDTGNESSSLLGETSSSGRRLPLPPEYQIEESSLPPPYRLPPPYNSGHLNW